MVAAKRKRPWYLVLSLVGAISLGSMGACNGWSTVTLYRESIDPTIVGQQFADDADRAAVVARFQSYLETLDAAKARGWPLAVASLLLGVSVLIAAIRTMRGKGSARRALVQLIIAQAAVSALSYWLMPDVFDSSLRFAEAKHSAEIHQGISDRPRADEVARAHSRVLHAATPIDFALRIVGSALVVFALTRRRAQELLDAANEAMGAP